MIPLLLLLSVAGCIAAQQFGGSQQEGGLPFAIQPPPPPLAMQRPVEIGDRRFAHRAVLINSENEALLPPEMQNRFYKNPRIAEALAKESWFIPGEQQVIDREAEKIPRHKIYSLLKNAGFVNKRRRRSTFRY